MAGNQYEPLKGQSTYFYDRRRLKNVIIRLKRKQGLSNLVYNIFKTFSNLGQFLVYVFGFEDPVTD